MIIDENQRIYVWNEAPFFSPVLEEAKSLAVPLPEEISEINSSLC
jgi:hypothetical protein